MPVRTTDETPEPRSRPTLALIAAEAGVSPATVSKVLNGRTDVAASTRERIEELLRTHNYPGPGGARRARRSGLIDLVLAGLDSPWAVEILRGVEAECAEHGTGVVVSLVREDDARPPSWQNLPALHHSDGVILVTSRMSRRQRDQLARAGVGLVLVDPVNIPDNDIPSVGATNWAGGKSATEHLIELGHRRIGMIGGPAGMLCTPGAGRRLPDGAGARRDRGRQGPRPVRRLPARGRVRPHARAARSSPIRRPAIFAGSDEQAMGAYEAARLRRPAHPRGPQRRRLRRPADLRVALATADDGPPAAGGDGPASRPAPCSSCSTGGRR